jgi:hypothetical protein
MQMQVHCSYTIPYNKKNLKFIKMLPLSRKFKKLGNLSTAIYCNGVSKWCEQFGLTMF